MGLAWSSCKSKRKDKKAHKRKLRKQLKEAEECITGLQKQLQFEIESIDQYQNDSFPDTETAKTDCIVAEMEEEVQALERKLSLEEIAANITDERCNFHDRNFRLLQQNEVSLDRQSSACETDVLAALKLKQETCQFGQFLQANPVEKWTVCSLPNLYFRDL